MHHRRFSWLLLTGFLLGLTAGPFVRPFESRVQANEDEKKFEDFKAVTQGAKEYEGLIRLWKKGERLYAELTQQNLNRPYLAPMAIAQGLGQGGLTLNFSEQWVLMFKRVGDRIHLVRRNVRFQAKKGTAIAAALETTYTDSVLMSLRIVSVNPARDSVLINLNDILMTDFAQLNRGQFDASRSTWHKIKAFPKNIELEVAATYTGGGRGETVIDNRGVTVILHYSLCALPEDGYQPRLADDRVGHFLTAVKDYSNDNTDTPFVRYVNRWRLERAEPENPKFPGKLSAPKKKIVFWIEKSVPEEYRAYVRDGILEWNKAFEKIGFRDAIEVRQQEDEDFDPEDVTYATFRWTVHDEGYAMGPSRANPLTGEIFDADIIFDASMVRYYRLDKGLFGNKPLLAEPISPILAARQGWGLQESPAPGLKSSPQGAQAWYERRSSWTEEQFQAIQHGLCNCGPAMKRELTLAGLTLLANGPVGPDGRPTPQVVEEMVGQAIKDVTMHEVGHTLGLRHNFKGSTMLRNEDMHNPTITREKGLLGSVMDYPAINLAPKGVKQGDYFTTTLGPYDYWAIEYAYKPLSGGTEGEVEKLREIAARGAGPGLDFGTDEDLRTADPRLNVWDLGADPMKFATDRIALTEELLKTLGDKASVKGEGYQRTREAFSRLMQELGNGAALIAQHVGGVSIHRDHKEDPNGRDPQVPIPAAKQREALKFLQVHILDDAPFTFSPALLRRLSTEHWLHWGSGQGMMEPVEYPVNEQVLRIQRVALDLLLSARVLARVQNNALRTEKEEKPLTLAEVFRSLTDSIWKEPSVSMEQGKKVLVSTVIRRNLQREHLRELAQIAMSSNHYPPDARSLARMHLQEIGDRIGKVLADKAATVEDTTRAHLLETRDRLTKVLNAGLQVQEP